MALRKSVELLPELFRTRKNQKFLNATVDQLISEKASRRINGYIGRRGIDSKTVGEYVREVSAFRENYQVEPGIVYQDAAGTVQSVSSLIDALNSINYNRGNSIKQDPLYKQQFYNWASFIDFDKFINYGEYFWLPSGPDSVQVFAGAVDATQNFTVYREGTTYDQIEFDTVGFDEGLYDERSDVIESGQPVYRFNSETATPNPTLYLARGGEYTFEINQPGVPFWIQTERGLSGISQSQQNLSTREIAGVINNGEDDGTIIWRVPKINDQNQFTEMTVDFDVDLVSELTYGEIHNQSLSAFLDSYETGIDGLTEIDGKYLVLVNDSRNEDDWNQGDLFDGYPYDSGEVEGSSGTFDPVTTLSLAERYGVFRIDIETVSGVETIKLIFIQNIAIGHKVKVKQGIEYGSREFYKDAEGYLRLVPPLTALQSEFFYQDAKDTDRFGKIVLVDVDGSGIIDINEEILNKITYTSPNGVVFSNGLKIEFDTSVVPASYKNKQYYVEGVGKGIVLVDVDDLITPETYTESELENFDTQPYDIGGYEQTLNSPTKQDYITINRSSVDSNGWSRSNRWFHRDIITATAEYNNYIISIDDSQRAKRPIIEFDAGLRLFNLGITSKHPVSIVDTEETDAFSNVNGSIGYFADGINITPGMTICFTKDPDIKKNIYRIDFIDQDSNTNTNPIINLVKIDEVSDLDTLVSKLGSTNQGKIFYYKEDDNSWHSGQDKTSINQAPLFDVFDPDHVSFSNTTKYPSTTFAGCKLFSYKRNNNANADTILEFGLSYKNIGNIGDILFTNNYVTDKFSYTKETAGNVSVIVRSGHVHKHRGSTRTLLNGWETVAFESRQYQQVRHVVDKELYVFEIGVAPAQDSNAVNLHVYVNGEYKTSADYAKINVNEKHYVSFYDALKAKDVVIIKVYSDDVNPLGFYEVPLNLENNSNNKDFEEVTLGQVRNHFISMTREHPLFSGKSLGSNNLRDLDYKKYPGKILQHSAGAAIPHFLLTRKENSFVESLRFGMEEYTRFKNRLIDNINNLDIDLRNPSDSLDTILQYMAGAKTSDFPFYYTDMLPWGSQKTTISITLDQTTDRRFEFNTQFDLTKISSRGVLVYLIESNKKTLLVEGFDYTFDTVEPAITLSNSINLEINDVIEISEYTDTNGSFVPPTPTKLGLYPKFYPAVALDDTYQTGTTESTGPFKIYGSSDSRYEQRAQGQTGWFYPLYTTSAAAAAADASGRSHAHRFAGSDRIFYMPTTGQYHATNNTDEYQEYPIYTPVILGHDGSRWVAYKDRRDEVILEFEKRVYNNIKTQYDPLTFDIAEVLPGYFRTDIEDLALTDQIIAPYVATWVYKNRLNFSNNTVTDPNNSFTWNYGQSITADRGSRVPGYWRGIYKWLYDTETPHLTPWEMLGLYQKPTWWDTRYGKAPYTRGNYVLWEDLSLGKIYNEAGRDAAYTIDPLRKRPTLLNYVPVNEQGQLLAPDQFLINGAFKTNTNFPWKIGDYAPVETAWRRSSEWPFAVQIIAAIKRTAKYLTLNWDKNLLAFNREFNQVLQKNKSYRPMLVDFKINGLAVSANSDTVNRIEGYNQFFENYYKYRNYDISDLQTQIQNLTTKLIYQVGGFTDLKNFKIAIDSTSPTSLQGGGVFIPDENINIFVNKSIPLERVFYSGVNIIKRAAGFEVRGFDTTYPFFKIIPSIKSDNKQTITVGDRSVVLFNDSHNYIASVPYGTIISSTQQLVDFLIAYQRYLTNRGLIFESKNSNGDLLDFNNAVKEFLLWTQQDWSIGSVFAVSPAGKELSVDRAFTTIDDFSKARNILNNSGQPIKPADINVIRIDNKTTIESNTDKGFIYSASIDPIQFEHVLVFDNVTVFNDVIYQPELGNRQSRFKFIGTKSSGWNGTLHAPGYFINENKFNIWIENTDYKKGTVVSFNNKVYAAKTNHTGKTVFDYNDWLLVENMQTGLIPNLANKANSFTEYYDLDNINLESATDLAAKGQIGFRKRNYLDNLGLDDISQVKFYQGMIRSKGTKDVIDKLVNADLTNLDQEIDVYEEWGFRVGEFGSIDSNQVIEMVLDEDRVRENPTVLQLLDNGDTANQDYYSFRQADLYKIPNNFQKNIILNRTSNVPMQDIIGAGHPRLDDVTLTLFDLDDIKTLNNQITTIGRGTTIWTAKNNFDWDIYRVTEINTEIISVKQSSAGTITCTTNFNHGLVKNDIVIIKTNNDLVRGFHKVNNVKLPNTFEILLDADEEIDDSVDLRLPIYKLVSSRFTNMSDIAGFVPPYGWSVGELAWVDYDENSKWAAYRKQSPWKYNSVNISIETGGNAANGTSLAVADDALLMVSGAPEEDTGRVYPYVWNVDNNRYDVGITLVGDTISSEVDAYGKSTIIGQNWLAVGAPSSDSSKGYVFVYKRNISGVNVIKQIIRLQSPVGNDQFGHSLAISKDDRHLFIGTPTVNKVYMYTLVEVSSEYETSETIVGDGSTVNFNLTFTPSSIYSIYLEDGNGKSYVAFKDYTLSSNTVTFTTAPAASLSIVIRKQSHYVPVTTITGSDVMSGDQFGFSIDVDSKGETLIVGSPSADVADEDSTVIVDAGEAYLFHHIVERFTGNGSTYEFTTSNTLPDHFYIEVDGAVQSLATGEFGGFDSDSSANRYTVSGNTISFRYIPATNSDIRVYTGNFAEIQKIDQNFAGQSPTDSELFGYSVGIDAYGAIVAIGSPGEDELNPNSGSAFIFVDEGLRFGQVTTQSTDSSTFSVRFDSIFINDYEVVVSKNTTNDPTKLSDDINSSEIIQVSSQVSGNNLKITSTSAVPNKRLKVRPGTGSTFKDFAEVKPFKFTQKLNHPLGADNENFGRTIAFDKHIPINNPAEQRLIVASDRASAALDTGFDIDTDTLSRTYNEFTTTFDANSTRFVDKVRQSGAVYLYDLLDSTETIDTPMSITNPPKYAFGQQLQSTKINQLDQFGASAAIHRGKLFVGSPADDEWVSNAGSFYYFTNSDNEYTWEKYRVEEDKVDISAINRIVTYNNRNKEIISFVDTVDIFKNKLPGLAQQELDYITPLDPATYNVSSNKDSVTDSETSGWNDEKLGRVWWDLSTCRVLEYEQGDDNYRVQNWNRFFPGSSIDIYEWTESTVLPSQHVDSGLPGTPRYPDDSNYVVNLQYNSVTNTTQTRYYYWVTGLTTFPNDERRQLSTESVRQLIENPIATGTKFVNVINSHTFVLNNLIDDLSGTDTVLSINYDVVKNEGILHSEFDLISENDPTQELPSKIKNKIIDSLAGANSIGNIVPDPTLGEGERYGVSIRPRQTMFKNRQLAVKTFVDYCNAIFTTVPIARQFNLSRLFASEPAPLTTSGEWNRSVPDLTTRDYINLRTISAGYRVLVESDSSVGGDWTIYELEVDSSDNRTWSLYRVQAYNTGRYWNYINWYADGYSNTTVPRFTVDTEPDLLSLTAVTGDVARVRTNDDGNFSLFVYTNIGTWREVAIENGSIEIRSSIYDFANTTYSSFIGFDSVVFDFERFDRVPHNEMRIIANAIFDEIFTGNLALNKNKLFFRLIEYSLHELDSGVSDWAIKTGFIRVLHKLRNLDQYPNYQLDNSTFIEDYINEVKPYHTYIREYSLRYKGNDEYLGDVTDFDTHSFYDSVEGYFRKPSGDFAGDEIIRTQGLNNPWSENYTYYLDSVEIYNGGSGFLENPVITVSEPNITGGQRAEVTAITNGTKIISVSVVKKGSGYTQTPIITYSGSGTGLVLLPRIANDAVREFDTTIKFDRITYSSSIQDWQPNTSYSYNTLIAYYNTNTGIQDVYRVDLSGGFTSGSTFSLEDASGATALVTYNDEDFANAADRIAAYYYPTQGMIGDDLKLLQKGTDYFANKVSGIGFDREPGYDQGNFDTLGFDDFEIDTNGLTVLAGASALDSVIKSTFSDLALGTRPEDINVAGGEFVDVYNSHSPEEFVPGIVFDTLDIEVYTDPSDDFAGDGNSFKTVSRVYIADGTTNSFSYANTTRRELVDYIVAYHGSTRKYDFTVNYQTRTVRFASTPAAGTLIYLYGYGVTGEKITHEELIIGDGSSVSFTLGIDYTRYTQSLVLRDGVPVDHTITNANNRVNITTTTTNPNGSVIHAYISNRATDKPAFTRGETMEISLTAGTYEYELDYNFRTFTKSFESNVIVELNGVRLKPSNAKYYTLDGSTLAYRTPTTAGEDTTNVSVGDIQVSVIRAATNTIENLNIVQDYTVSIETDIDSTLYYQVNLLDAYSAGDSLIIGVRNANEYFINNDLITLDSGLSFSTGNTLYITQFYNHDPIRVHTKVFIGEGSETTSIIIGYDENGFDSGNFDGVTLSGTALNKYTMDRIPTNANNLWVTLDGVRLHSGEYSIDINGRIDLSSQTITAGSEIIVTHFSELIIEPTIGYRMTKNMLGDYEYFRLCADGATKLARDLLPTDTVIYLKDASKLPVVSVNSDQPGVIYLGNERITYWQISHDENYITNIRRATHGTRFANLHLAGTEVYDTTDAQRLPATDTHTKTWYDLGSITAANGNGLQASSTTNANFIKACEAFVPAYVKELESPKYVEDDYVDEFYVVELPLG